MSLSKLQEVVKGREAWQAAVSPWGHKELDTHTHVYIYIHTYIYVSIYIVYNIYIHSIYQQWTIRNWFWILLKRIQVTIELLNEILSIKICPNLVHTHTKKKKIERNERKSKFKEKHFMLMNEEAILLRYQLSLN